MQANIKPEAGAYSLGQVGHLNLERSPWPGPLTPRRIAERGEQNLTAAQIGQASARSTVRKSETSTITPGPIVELTATFFT
jgi:hypothetical protein